MAVFWREGWMKNWFVHHALRVGFAVAVTALLIPFKLDVLDYTAYDWRMQLSPRPAPSGRRRVHRATSETIEL